MTAQTTKPAHSKGLDFERAANIIQNKIRANHEVAPLNFENRHTDEFSWFNAVGKLLEKLCQNQ